MDRILCNSPTCIFPKLELYYYQKVRNEKMTKKQLKAKNNKNRVLVPFNTGTRTMKSAKYPTRQERKKIIDNY